MIKAQKKKRVLIGKGYGENLYRNLDTALCLFFLLADTLPLFAFKIDNKKLDFKIGCRHRSGTYRNRLETKPLCNDSIFTIHIQ